MSHDPTKKPLSSHEITMPFTPKAIEHLKAIGNDIIQRYGGYGSITVEVFRGEISDIHFTVDMKQGYQF